MATPDDLDGLEMVSEFPAPPQTDLITIKPFMIFL